MEETTWTDPLRPTAEHLLAGMAGFSSWADEMSGKDDTAERIRMTVAAELDRVDDSEKLTRIMIEQAVISHRLHQLETNLLHRPTKAHITALWAATTALLVLIVIQFSAIGFLIYLHASDWQISQLSTLFHQLVDFIL